MLSVNKPLMDAAFNKLCIKGTGTYTSAKSAGTIYKAAYEAYYNKAAEKLPKSDPDDKDLQDKLRSEGLLVNDIKKQLEDDAHDFASLFADAMKECLKEVSTQIDAHIKSASINITIPALLPTIISPMGPCTGSLTIGEATGAIINIM
jgi:hypothetical protein